MSEEQVFGSKVLKKFFGNDDFPVDWANEEEKQYHWFFDDLHCPNPVSPMYATMTPWWGKSCEYMYRRFWAPFGKEWLGKVINQYVYTAIKPREAKEAEIAGKYYGKIMPVYARNFLRWWNERLLPEIERNYQYLDNFDYENASLDELMILLEDYLDIFERHFNLHWILNLAQFQASLEFRLTYQDVFGSVDDEEIGKILVSVDDKNWDAIRGLAKLKEYVKTKPELKSIFEATEDPQAILEALKTSPAAKEFMEKLDAYLKEYGYKSIFDHELQFELWIENPAPAIETIRTYLKTEYDVEADIQKTKRVMEDAIQQVLDRAPTEADRKRLQEVLDMALPMQPLTPNHHFWMDQACHARGRVILLAIGRRFVDTGLLEDKGDTVFLTYDQLRSLYADPQALDAKAIVAEVKKQLQAADKLVPADWLGTVTRWSNYEEPYKALWGFPEKVERDPIVKGVKEFQGIPGSPGVVEGTAILVKSPQEFDRVRPGDIMVCRVTSPAWITVFPKLKALVTDAGGMLAHPAVVSREFGIPAVVGTGQATQMVRTGQRLRVDGTNGRVYILD